MKRKQEDNEKDAEVKPAKKQKFNTQDDKSSNYHHKSDKQKSSEQKRAVKESNRAVVDMKRISILQAREEMFKTIQGNGRLVTHLVPIPSMFNHIARFKLELVKDDNNAGSRADEDDVDKSEQMTFLPPDGSIGDHLDNLLQKLESLFETETREKARVDVRLASTKPKTTAEQQDALSEYKKSHRDAIVKLLNVAGQFTSGMNGLVPASMPSRRKSGNSDFAPDYPFLQKSIWQYCQPLNLLTMSHVESLLPTISPDDQQEYSSQPKTLGDLFK